MNRVCKWFLSLAVALIAWPHPALGQTTITRVTYFARPAYRLSNGKTEAVVVPAIGRIMRYGKIGGPNVLWNSPTSKGISGEWKNYGGDKNWLAPSSSWKVFHDKLDWPPDPAFDGMAQQTRVLPGRKLQMTSGLSPRTGIRFVRTMYFDPNGDFVIEQTARKSRGATVRASIWSITQVVPGSAVFLPLNPDSAYKNGYYNLQTQAHAGSIEAVKPRLLQVKPKSQGSYKIGLDSKVSRLVSMSGRVAFLVESDTPAGKYPDGADKNGFPVEIYVNGDPKVFYSELELLGPLLNFTAGSKSTRTVHWSLHELPSSHSHAVDVIEAVEHLLYKK